MVAVKSMPIKKERNPMKNWQYKMHAVVRNTIREQIQKADKGEGFDPDVVNLYLQLEKMSKQMLANGEMNEGDNFRVPLEDGTIMDISFYRAYSTVAVESLETGKYMEAVLREDSAKQEYRFLEGLSFALQNASLGIGPHYPKSFEKAINEAKPGDILHFDNNKAYVCVANQSGTVSFHRISNSNKTPDISSIKEYETVGVVKGMPLEIQKFYRQVHDAYTDDVKFKATSLTDARGVLNKLLANREYDKELVVGPNKFLVKKAEQGKGLSYYDESGNQVPESRMLYLLGCLKASPNSVEINRLAHHTPQNQFNDTECKRAFEHLMAENRFKDSFRLLNAYLKQNEGAVQVNMSSYMQTDKNFEAVSFKFECKNGEIQIQKLSYKDNDFSKGVSHVESASMDEVLAYCAQKYDDTFSLVKSNIMNDIYKDYPNWSGQYLDRYVEKLAKQEMMSLSVFEIHSNDAASMDQDYDYDDLS